MSKRISITIGPALVKLLNTNSYEGDQEKFKHAYYFIYALMLFNTSKCRKKIYPDDKQPIAKYFDPSWHEGKKLFEALRRAHRITIIILPNISDTLKVTVRFYDKDSKTHFHQLDVCFSNQGITYLGGSY